MDAKYVDDNHEILLESLSAMIDDELSFAESQKLLAKIKANPKLHEKWRHFCVIKAILHRKVHAPMSINEFVSQAMVHKEAVESYSLRANKPD